MASTVSVLAYDFFFIPPFFTFVVDDQRHLLTFAMMFVVGLLFSGLTQRVRRNEQRVNEALLRARTEENAERPLERRVARPSNAARRHHGRSSTLRERAHESTDAEKTDLLDTIREEADRLERLVRNLLLLTLLAQNAGRVLTQRQILEQVWGRTHAAQSHYVRVFMAQLRRKSRRIPLARSSWSLSRASGTGCATGSTELMRVSTALAATH